MTEIQKRVKIKMIWDLVFFGLFSFFIITDFIDFYNGDNITLFFFTVPQPFDFLVIIFDFVILLWIFRSLNKNYQIHKELKWREE